MNLLEELENKSFRLNSKYEQQILQMYNEDLIKLKDANEIFSRFEQQVIKILAEGQWKIIKN